MAEACTVTTEQHPELIPGAVPYYHDAEYGQAIYCGDCRELLPLIPDGAVDLVLTDPPYGIKLPTDYHSRGRGALAQCRDYQPVYCDDEPFDPAPLLRFGNCILWGANYYASKLPDVSGWLVWDKMRPDGVDQADLELAWTNCVNGARSFHHLWHGCMRASEHGTGYHPTQKPVALIKWCLSKVPKLKGLVLDPYMGAGPVAVACRESRQPYIGIEIEERYCEIAAKRLQQGVFNFADQARCAPRAEALLPLEVL